MVKKGRKDRFKAAIVRGTGVGGGVLFAIYSSNMSGAEEREVLVALNEADSCSSIKQADVHHSPSFSLLSL